MAPRGASSSSLPEGGDEIPSRKRERRNQAEDQRRGERSAEGEREDPGIEDHVVEPGNARPREQRQELDPASRQENAEDAADEGEEEALDHDHTRQTEAARPHGGADRELAFRRAEAGEEELRDVSAGDEEHEPDRGHQDPESGESPLDDVAVQRNGAHLQIRRLVLGVLFLELGLEGLHLFLGLFERDARAACVRSR